jgi:hypothetical protein
LKLKNRAAVKLIKPKGLRKTISLTFSTWRIRQSL